MNRFVLPELPSSWVSVDIDKVTDIAYGEALRAEERAGKGGIPVYGSNGIVGEHNEALHSGPSIIIGRKGTVGSVYYVPSPFWCIDTSFYLKDISPLINVEYLAHILAFLNLSRLTIVVGVPGISRKDIEGIPIPVPPLAEQRRIVESIHEVNELGRLRADTLTKSDLLLPSVFRQFFGDPAVNEKKWPTRSLKRLGSVTTGNTPSRDYPENFGDFVEWVKSDNLDSPLDVVTATRERLSKKGARIGRIVPKGSTLITCIAGSPESIGKAALADRELAFNQQINAVTPFEETNPYFLYALIKLSKRAIQALSSGGMKGIVNKSQLERLSVIFPPKELQDRFAPKLIEIFDYKTELVKSQEKIKRLVRSLLARAFSGELTTKWREENEAIVRAEASERDRSLGQTAKFRRPSHERVKETKPVLLKREYLITRLSRKQLHVLEVVKTMKSDHPQVPSKEYFTARDIDAAQQRISAEALAKIMESSFSAEEINTEQQGTPFLSHSDAMQSLQLLAEMGLIRRVRLAANPSGREVMVFAPAFRQIEDDDDEVGLRDLANLEVERA